ncbi:MAG: hypothetical protein AAGF13_10885 [Pseudomonadota bacterium]
MATPTDLPTLRSLAWRTAVMGSFAGSFGFFFYFAILGSLAAGLGRGIGGGAFIGSVALISLLVCSLIGAAVIGFAVLPGLLRVFGAVRLRFIIAVIFVSWCVAVLLFAGLTAPSWHGIIPTATLTIWPLLTYLLAAIVLWRREFLRA